MRRLLNPWFPAVAMLATGCIIYTDDTKNSDDDWVEPPITDPWAPDTDGGTDPGDPGQIDTAGDDTGSDTPVVTVKLDLDPDAGYPGDVLIVSLLGNDQIDLTTVKSVEFLGSAGVEVLTTRDRDAGELLLAIQVPDDATPGSQDILVRLDDGSGVFADEAFDVLDTLGDSGM